MSAAVEGPPVVGRVPGRLRSLLLLVGVVAVVAGLVLWATAPEWASKGSSSANGTFVVVTQVDWDFVGAEGCWPNATTGGIVLLSGAVWFTGVDLAYSISKSMSCVAQALAASTPGFGLLNDSAPVTVPGSGPSWLWANVSLPAVSFQGPLLLYVIVTSADTGG